MPSMQSTPRWLPAHAATRLRGCHLVAGSDVGIHRPLIHPRRSIHYYLPPSLRVHTIIDWLQVVVHLSHERIRHRLEHILPTVVQCRLRGEYLTRVGTLPHRRAGEICRGKERESLELLIDCERVP